MRQELEPAKAPGGARRAVALLVAFLATLGFGAPVFAVPGLEYLPEDVAVIAYVEVAELLGSELGRGLRDRLSQTGAGGLQSFQEGTGIDFETDVDTLLLGLRAQAAGGGAVAIFSGRFDRGRIESYALERGGAGEIYREAPLISRPRGDSSSAVAFLGPGVIATGETEAVRAAVDCLRGSKSVKANTELTRRVARVAKGVSLWAVGDLDRTASQGIFPAAMTSRIGWFALSAIVGDGVQAELVLETRDEAAATDLRAMIEGALAGMRQSAGAGPELRAVAESLELAVEGRELAVSVRLPAALFARPGGGP